MGTSWEYLGIPSGNYTIEVIENVLFEIVDLPIKNDGSFHGYGTVYRRVKPT